MNNLTAAAITAAIIVASGALGAYLLWPTQATAQPADHSPPETYCGGDHVPCAVPPRHCFGDGGHNKSLCCEDLPSESNAQCLAFLNLSCGSLPISEKPACELARANKQLAYLCAIAAQITGRPNPCPVSLAVPA
jgi:hypothetical protein